jgi:hypothetical protein
MFSILNGILLVCGLNLDVFIAGVIWKGFGWVKLSIHDCESDEISSKLQKSDLVLTFAQCYFVKPHYSGHVYDALATLRPRKSFVRHPTQSIGGMGPNYRLQPKLWGLSEYMVPGVSKKCPCRVPGDQVHYCSLLPHLVPSNLPGTF